MSRKMFTLLVAASAAAAGHAQQPGSSNDESNSREIVVEGSRDPDRQISDFVNALTRVPIGGQLGRYDYAVCPVVVGLSDETSSAVRERMRRVARTAGIKVADDGCRPNALVIVTGDKGEFVERLRARYPAYFEGVPDVQVRRMVRDASPAAAWYVEGRLDADGVEVPRDPVTGTYVVERTDVASRLSTASRPHFVASVVVIELDALAGLTPTQLGDYAAMRAFARTDPSRLKDLPVRSILTIIDAPSDASVPVTLTDWDLAFLKALYGSSESRLATQQRGDMKRLMREQVLQPEAAPE